MSDLLTRDLKQLIRIYNDDALADATALAARILTPFKSELDRATHKFSTQLFIAATLYTVFNHDEPTLNRVLECIVDLSTWETEKKMLAGIADGTTSTHGRVRGAGVREWFKRFYEQNKNLSPGSAQRIVMACHAQWRKAFNLPALRASVKVMATPKGTSTLDHIRIGTRYELSDATTFAINFLRPVQSNTDNTTYAFAYNLFIITSLTVAHEVRLPTLASVLEFLVDPGWDSEKQIINHLGRASDTGVQKNTALWRDSWYERTIAMPDGSIKSLIKRSYTLWLQAYLLPEPAPKDAAKPTTKAVPAPVSSIQIFNLEAIGRAQTLMSECKEDRKGGGERILESAQANGGYRIIPDPKKAGEVLEQAKREFENLHEPIKQLQLNLALAAAMKPEKFRVRPILLLGDPGIGKTYLAMALADSLGGGMEKISAGGAQGGFQLNGSHSSWTGGRCGQIFRTLAESKTTSPVFVIDEIDKMGSDDRYPMLPVLLDLFEPATAKTFKDEFFEISFDASRIIFILTANDIAYVPAPLRSRVTVFNVPRPEPAQRLRIIENEARDLREATSSRIKLDKITTQELANRVDLDLRITVAIVQECFTKALMGNKKTAYPVIDKDAYAGEKPAGYHRSNFGFCGNEKPAVEQTSNGGRSR